MAKKIRVFLDTSALFASLWSATGGARLAFRLGEVGAVQLVVSSQVIMELENAIRKKAPHLLGLITFMLDRGGVEIVRKVSKQHFKILEKATGHEADAHIICAALGADISFFVTFNRKHFLDPLAKRPNLPFPIGTPGDFIAWFKKKVNPIEAAIMHYAMKHDGTETDLDPALEAAGVEFLLADRLHMAAEEGNLDEVKQLIQEGFQVNDFDELGMTPLHHAAEKGHVEVMRYLLDSGADVNAHDESRAGNTPLGEVAGNCSFEVAKILIDAGADPTIPGWMQLTALHKAAERKKPEGQRIYKLLKKAAK